MSRYDKDCKAISFIQFHCDDFTQDEKNRIIKFLEDVISKEEQLELDGKGTGYYE